VQVHGGGAGTSSTDGTAAEEDLSRTPDDCQEEAVARIPSIGRWQDVSQETTQKADAEESEVMQKITKSKGHFERT
jgi:hypothetical protein